MIWLALGSLVPSALVCWAAAWLLRLLGPRYGWVDRPGRRKIHAAPMPTGGGLAIWLGIVGPLAAGQLALWFALRTAPGEAVARAVVPEFVARHLAGLWYQSGRLWILLAGGTALVVLGLADDRRGLAWPIRLAVETLVAAAMVGCGWRVNLPGDVPLAAGAVSVVWIVALVNAFNMLDNMDGLSAGVAAIAAAMLAATALLAPRPDNHQPQLFVAGFLLVLAGSLAGFLWHNRPPARLFMGDAGSYLIGYLLAMATLTATFAGEGQPRHGVLAPLCVLAVPFYDMGSVVWIRLREGRSPFTGDTSHFSHRLVALGMTTSQAVLTIYLATATCGLGALLLHEVDRLGACIILLLVASTLLLIAVLETAGRKGGILKANTHQIKAGLRKAAEKLRDFVRRCRCRRSSAGGDADAIKSPCHRVALSPPRGVTASPDACRRLGSELSGPPGGRGTTDLLRAWLLCGTTALMVARPLFPSESAAGSGDGLTLVMIWLVLAAVWLLAALRRPHWEVRFGWPDAAVGLLVVLEAVAAFRAAGRFSPRPSFNMLWEWVGLGLVFFLARQLIRSGREARAVIAVMIGLSTAIAGYGLYQYGVELPAARAAYARDPDRAMREAEAWYPPGSQERELFERRMERPEPLGTFALTNSLAALLAPWLVTAVAVAAAVRANRRRVAAVLTCAAVIAACLVLTKSRSGYAAAAVGLVLLGLGANRARGLSRFSRDHAARGVRNGTVPFGRTRWGWKPALGAAVAAVVLAAAIAATGAARPLWDKAAKSLGYRVEYWRATTAMIADAPLGGCGPGNFQDAYTRYKLPEASEEVADPHNFLLEIWATAGTPAAAALLAALTLLAWQYRRGASTMTRCSAGDAPPPGVPCRFIYGGAVVGFLLSVPLGQLSAAPPGLALLVLGLPLAAACMLLLRGWVHQGPLPAGVPALGVLVMVIDLSATGGIALPGVAGTFWLLLALGLDAWTEGDSPVFATMLHMVPAKIGTVPRVLPRSAALVAFGSAAALTVACYATGYAPVLKCQALLRSAQRRIFAGQTGQARRDLEAAAAADPRSAEPQWQLAGIALEDWLRQPQDEAYDRFEKYTAAALGLAPQSAVLRFVSGERYVRIFSTRDHYGARLQPAALRPAIEDYRRAVELYPASGLHRARLAVAYDLAGDAARARREAAAALELDDRTPHADRKLPSALRVQLLRVASEKRLR